MGFAITPEPHKKGVYYHLEADQYVVVESVFFFFGADVWYRKGQRRTRLANNGIFSKLIYIGEFE